MMDVVEVRRWLSTLYDTSCVAVDDGGLQLVEIDENGQETGAYCEIGGIPLDEEEEEQQQCI